MDGSLLPGTIKTNTHLLYLQLHLHTPSGMVLGCKLSLYVTHTLLDSEILLSHIPSLDGSGQSAESALMQHPWIRVGAQGPNGGSLAVLGLEP